MPKNVGVLSSTDFEPSNKGTWYPSDKAKQKKRELLGPRPGLGDDPLWCRYCQKRFAKRSVMDGHLLGELQPHHVLEYRREECRTL